MTALAVDATDRDDPVYLRRVLGRLPTAVVVVTAITPEGAPVGMTVGTFTSVSLEPPLVGFLPDRRSRSWAAIRAAGRFCANILSDDQEAVCRVFAGGSEERYAGVEWRPSPSGSPILAGVTAWIDCEIDAVHVAGDHDIVVARVGQLRTESDCRPLVFLQGGYGRVSSLSLTAWDRGLLGPMRLADIARDRMEQVAADVGRECILSAVVQDEIVMVASAGSPVQRGLPTRVGQRIPLTSPLAVGVIAWGSAGARQGWLARAGADLAPGDRARLAEMLDLVRRRGFSIAVGRDVHVGIELCLRASATRDRADGRELSVRDVLVNVDPIEFDQAPGREVRSLAVPVLDANGQAGLTLGVHRLPPTHTVAEIHQLAARLHEAAESISALVGTLSGGDG